MTGIDGKEDGEQRKGLWYEGKEWKGRSKERKESKQEQLGM